MATAKTKKVSTDRIIKLMQSEDYKDRLEKLSAKLEKDREEIGDDDAIKRQYIGYGKTADIGFIGDPNPSLYLLARQKRCMTEYLHILEKRAEIEKIKL